MDADDVKRFVMNLLRLGRLIRRGIQVTPTMRLRIVALVLKAINERRGRQKVQTAVEELLEQAVATIPVLPLEDIRAAVLARLPAEPVVVSEVSDKKPRRGRRKAKAKPIEVVELQPSPQPQPQIQPDAEAEADAIVAQLLAADPPETEATDTLYVTGDADTPDVTEDSDDIRE